MRNAVFVRLLPFAILGLFLGFMIAETIGTKVITVKPDYSGERIAHCMAAAEYLNTTSTNKDQVVEWYHSKCTHLEAG